ncbi:MAG: shikimate dehydrogenase [Ruminococcaceae bacterium]|nr:shikimate dehydrogenase [Oscillospiraceae bacterium]
MQYGCIAEHLGHSFSREIHGALADYSYELRELTPEQLDGFMREKEFCGINVTIPYKATVIPYLDEIDEAAQRIGAVNTVVNRNGRLYGYNTDFYGMSAMIAHLGLCLAGKKVAVLGTGGTSHTACEVARSMGAKSLLTVSRTARDGCITYADLVRENTDTQILINTTPCGMYPNPEGKAVDVAAFPALEGVVDAVYNPLRPQLVMDAMARGIPAEGGLYMLVAQAVRASEIFLDTEYPADTTERVYRKIFLQKENIVLVGMPACGKSTVGRLIAEHTGRAFCDLDEEIVKAAGMSIPEIFQRDGEIGFRNLETQVLKAVAQQNSMVLATGGGAILRDENVVALRRNGRLYFIDRPLEELMPTEDRPLASSREAIRKRFEERYPRYCAVADSRVPVYGDAEAVARSIEQEMI